jgi:hypothetical protein
MYYSLSMLSAQSLLRSKRTNMACFAIRSAIFAMNCETGIIEAQAQLTQPTFVYVR